MGETEHHIFDPIIKNSHLHGKCHSYSQLCGLYSFINTNIMNCCLFLPAMFYVTPLTPASYKNIKQTERKTGIR